jgi:hypothetical protein
MSVYNFGIRCVTLQHRVKALAIEQVEPEMSQNYNLCLFCSYSKIIYIYADICHTIALTIVPL